MPTSTQNKYIYTYIYFFSCSSTFSIQSIWQCYNNNTSLAPVSSHYVTFIFLQLVTNNWPVYIVLCVQLFITFSPIFLSVHMWNIIPNLALLETFVSAVISYWRFGTTDQSNHHYHSRLHNTPEEQISFTLPLKPEITFSITWFTGSVLFSILQWTDNFANWTLSSGKWKGKETLTQLHLTERVISINGQSVSLPLNST